MTCPFSMDCICPPPLKPTRLHADKVPDNCPRALINRERVGEGDPTLRALGVSRGFDFDSGNYRCSSASSSSMFPMTPPTIGGLLPGYLLCILLCLPAACKCATATGAATVGTQPSVRASASS